MLTAEEALREWAIRQAPPEIAEHARSCQDTRVTVEEMAEAFDGCPTCGGADEVVYDVEIVCRTHKQRGPYGSLSFYWSKSYSITLTDIVNELFAIAQEQ